MISKLGISIESSFQSDEKVQYDLSKTVVRNQIKANIAKIQISNYEVVATKRISYKEFAVMIRTNKIEFAKSLFESIKDDKKTIEMKYKSLENEDSLSRYRGIKKLLEESKLLKSQMLVLLALDKTFKNKPYYDLINKLQTRFIKEKNSLNFYVTGDRKSFMFINQIKNYLAKQKYSVVSKRNKDSIIVKLKTIESINKSSIIDIAVFTLIIDVFDKSKRIGGKSLIIKERFNGSINSVYKNASIHFEQDIKFKAINAVIGISMDKK